MNIIEVVLEGVAKSCVKELLALLIQSSENVINAQCSENISLFNKEKLSEKGLNEFMGFDENLTVLINLKTMNICGVILPSVQLRLVKYGDVFDVDFNFDCDDLKTASLKMLVNSLYAYTASLASDYDISSFYAGMEPASDEETRYFTNDKLGPLSA